MQIQAINRRAQQKFGNFISAMDLVLESFEAVDKLIARMDPKHAPGGFTVATPSELTGFKAKAFADLERLRATAKKYEAELISREWRV